MDRGAWWATAHGVTKSQTQLNNKVLNRAWLTHRHLLWLEVQDQGDGGGEVGSF